MVSQVTGEILSNAYHILIMSSKALALVDNQAKGDVRTVIDGKAYENGSQNAHSVYAEYMQI